MTTTTTYGNIVLANTNDFNGWYGFGQMPEALAKVVCNDTALAKVITGSGAELHSAIEVNRVVSCNESNCTLAITLDLTQLFAIPAPENGKRSLGRVVVGFDFGDQGNGASWITEDSKELIQAMFKCQQTLVKLHREGDLLINGELQAPFFDFDETAANPYGGVSPVRWISRDQAKELGLTEQDYPFRGGVKFSLVSTGFGLVRLNAAKNPATERSFIAVVARKPNPEEDTYTGPSGIKLCGLRAVGASSKSSVGSEIDLEGVVDPKALKMEETKEKEKASAIDW